MRLTEKQRQDQDQCRNQEICHLQKAACARELTEAEQCRLRQLQAQQRHFTRQTADRKAANAKGRVRGELRHAKRNVKGVRLNRQQHLANNVKRRQGLHDFVGGIYRQAERCGRADLAAAAAELNEQLRRFGALFNDEAAWTKAAIEPYRAAAQALKDALDAQRACPQIGSIPLPGDAHSAP